MFYNFIMYLLNFFMDIFFPYEVRKIDNFKNINYGFILCSNHLSNVDALFFMVLFHKIYHRKIYFLAKKELFKGFLINWVLREVGAIPIDRGSGDKRALKHAEKILVNSGCLGVFIEGTRSKTGKFLRPRSGVAFLALKTSVPVLPVCINPSNGYKIKLFKKTVINFGELIYFKGNQEEIIKIARNTAKEIMDKIKELKI